MRRKVILLLMILALFAFAGFRICEEKVTWLRNEQNGLCFEPDYLHQMMEKNRWELSKYLGGYISFALPLDNIVENTKTASFGEIEKLMIFKLDSEKAFMVDCSNTDVSQYKTGEILYVKGKLTAADGDNVYILNVYGCPGWPNNITIKPMSQF